MLLPSSGNGKWAALKTWHITRREFQTLQKGCRSSENVLKSNCVVSLILRACEKGLITV